MKRLDFVDESWVVPDGFGELNDEDADILDAMRTADIGLKEYSGCYAVRIYAGARVMAAVKAHYRCMGTKLPTDGPLRFRSAEVILEPSLAPDAYSMVTV